MYHPSSSSTSPPPKDDYEDVFFGDDQGIDIEGDNVSNVDSTSNLVTQSRRSLNNIHANVEDIFSLSATNSSSR